MDSRPRNWSKELPPDLSELMNKLIEYANSFIKEFDSSEAKMTEIVGEFQKIVDEVKKMQERTDTGRTVGAVTGGVGAGAGLMAFAFLVAPFTGGLSLAAAAAGVAAAAAPAAAATGGGAARAAAAGGAAALAAAAVAVGGPAAAVAAAGGGGAAVVGANVTKIIKENGSAKKVEELGKEFMEIIEPLKKNLEEIKTTCEKLEENSGGFQAENTLTGVEELQRILGRVSEVRKVSEGALIVVLAVMQMIGDLLVLIVKVFRVTATPEEDQKLRDAIIQSADQCQKVINQFDQMKKKLKDFIGN